MNNIQETRLSEIIKEISMGPFGSDIKTDNYVSNGVPVIRGGNLTSGRFNSDAGFVYLTEAKAQTLGKANAFPGDVLVTHRGTLGQVGIIPTSGFSNYVVSQSLLRMKINNELADSLYVYYFLKSPIGQQRLLANTSQTGVPAISQPVTSVKALTIPLPPLAEQQRIADILGTLDDKIELNRRQNATLEALARALFTAWFVDFEPVRAKAEGRWRQGESLPGMPAELWELFPDSFVDSALGPIPAGWGVGTVGDVVEVGIGKTPPRKESHWFSVSTSDIPWVSIRDMGNVVGYLSKTSEYLTHEAVDKFRIKRVPASTVLLSFKLTVGRVALTNQELVTNEAIAHFNVPHESNLTSFYLYLFLKSFDYDTLGSTSSIATAVNSDSIRQMQLLVPPKDIVQWFTTRVEKHFRQILANTTQSVSMTELRDKLMIEIFS
jgi:type I restriction enzyme S subunit